MLPVPSLILKSGTLAVVFSLIEDLGVLLSGSPSGFSAIGSSDGVYSFSRYKDGL